MEPTILHLQIVEWIVGLHANSRFCARAVSCCVDVMLCIMDSKELFGTIITTTLYVLCPATNQRQAAVAEAFPKPSWESTMNTSLSPTNTSNFSGFNAECPCKLLTGHLNTLTNNAQWSQCMIWTLPWLSYSWSQFARLICRDFTRTLSLCLPWVGSGTRD